MMPLIATNLHKEYITRSGTLPVLSGVSFELNPGDAVAITGPSGSGKSTLLHILGALDRPTSGTMELDGQNPFTLSEVQIAAFRNRKVGFVFQDHHLLPQFTVLENVLVPTLIQSEISRAEVERIARELLSRVGLADRLDHRPAELSGGERQRVAIARALVQKPPLLLADEPTGNLDHKNAQAIGELLFEMHRQQNTILIVVTHSTELARTFPKRFEMAEGRLIQAC